MTGLKRQGASRSLRACSRALAISMGLWSLLAAMHSAPLQAYPQWQLSTGAVRCTECHFSPGGGGLITEYGRDAMSGEQATFGGNGALLHGLARPPSWLAIGADLRGAYVAQAVQDPGGTKQAVFPMQADLEARAVLSDFSLYGTVGERVQVRPNDSLVPEQNYQPISTSRLISREHYLMWRPAAVGPYARVGRFYAPFGLRLAEHVLYIRRDLGLNQLEESYNLSVGLVGDTSEVHVTAFAPDFVRHIGGHTSGLAVYAERRIFDDAALVGGQGKLELGEDSTRRAILGLLGKRFVSSWKTLFFAEANGVRLMTDGGDSNQFVGLAGGSVFPVRGLMLTALVERRQTDLRVRDTGTDGAALLVNWFPYAHVELEAMGRLQSPSGEDTAKTLLVQLHYIL